ncbi:MAG: 16S rRNA (uracil(1498)-N(3))-methyltransferase [Propionibacteriaceae bacterium]
MTSALFLVEDPPAWDAVAPGASIMVTGDEGKHAVAVRRIKPGEQVFVADGRGQAIFGEVLSADKRGLDVRCDEILTAPAPDLAVTAVQALAKGDRSELAVETMTELSVATIVPWQASRSIVRWSEGERGAKQLSRWQSTAREATKQSRQFRIPEIAACASTKEVCARIATVDCAVILHEAATVTLAEHLTSWRADKGKYPATALIITGPEGGISPDELDAFIAAGAHPVLIADHVVRASTAGVVALAQLHALGGVDHG